MRFTNTDLLHFVTRILPSSAIHHTTESFNSIPGKKYYEYLTRIEFR